MAETQNAPITVEINDAIFCNHFNEVVRSYLHKMFPEYLSIAYSVLIVISMEEKRTILSLGWVLIYTRRTTSTLYGYP